MAPHALYGALNIPTTGVGTVLWNHLVVARVRVGDLPAGFAGTQQMVVHSPAPGGGVGCKANESTRNACITTP